LYELIEVCIANIYILMVDVTGAYAFSLPWTVWPLGKSRN